MNESKRDFEGLSDRSRCLPLEIRIVNSLSQVERICAGYNDGR